MRYSLRTLFLLMLLAGPLSALVWSQWVAYVAWRAEQAALQQSALRQSATEQLYAVDVLPPDAPRLLPMNSLETAPMPMPN